MVASRTMTTLLCALVLFATGCSGEDGPQGPVGPPGGSGTPLPIRTLFAGAEPTDTLQALAVDMFSRGLLPLGSVIHIVDITDSIPPLSSLNQYDAVLVWTTAAVTDPTALGNRLADYVDAGGGLVLGQMAFVDGFALGGRIMTPGYSPLLSAPPTGSAIARKIDFFSLTIPFHVILNGVSLLDLAFYSTDQWSNPVLAAGATRIALDDSGATAIAVNTADRVIGLNMSGNFSRGGYSEPAKLIVNSLLFVAGAF